MVVRSEKSSQHMKLNLLTIIASSLGIAPLVQAQVPVAIPAEIEGTLMSVTGNADGSATLQVMDVLVNVPLGTPISTPTSADIGIPALLDPTSFPGRSQAGFVGGTAIILGTVDAAGLLTADSAFFEPAENVVLGVVTPTETGDPTGSLRVNGMLVNFLTDPRITFDVPRNDLGFEVALASIEPLTEVGIEGYYSADTNAFYAFALEAVGVPAANPALQVAILRAQGRTDRGEIEVRGGVSGITGANAVTVQIFRVRPNGTFGPATRIGTVTAVRDELDPTSATFRFRATGVSPFPERVAARVVRAGVVANSEPFEVDAR